MDDFKKSELPIHLSNKEVSNLLGKEALELFFMLKNLEIKTGKEHSLFVDSEISNAFQSGKKFQDIMSIFLDQGRFKKNSLVEILSSNTPAMGSRYVPLDLIKGAPAEDQIFDLRCFVGHKGERSSLHFDWNVQSNLLVNLIGKKEFVLYSPKDSFLLSGYSNFFPPNSEVSHTATPFKFTLDAGEAVLIPPFWWHQAFYLESACSLSVRFKTFEQASSWPQHLYPSWKTVALYGQLGPERAVAFFESLYQLSVDKKDPREKFNLIEEKLDEALGKKITPHPYYEFWSCAYLHFKEMTESHDVSFY